MPPAPAACSPSTDRAGVIQDSIQEIPAHWTDWASLADSGVDGTARQRTGAHQADGGEGSHDLLVVGSIPTRPTPLTRGNASLSSV